jgi:protein phosphatase
MTDVGRVRPGNEDQFAIADLSRSAANCLAISSLDERSVGAEATGANLLVVADGVGGNLGGAWASRLAVEGVVEYFLCNRQPCERHAEYSGGQVLDDLTSALYWARECIQHEAEASPQHLRMGTTLTLAYLKWPVAYLAHAGDSRAYLYRTPELIQITRDQTMVQRLVSCHSCHGLEGKGDGVQKRSTTRGLPCDLATSHAASTRAGTMSTRCIFGFAMACRERPCRPPPI